MVPAFGLFELGLHVWQVQRALTAEDWDRAVASGPWRKSMRHPSGVLKSGDGVAVTPEWASPMLRRALGTHATLNQFAESDYSHLSRVWEFSLDGSSVLPTSWGEDTLVAGHGRIALRLRLNPHPEPMITDLLARASSGTDEALSVSRGTLGAETPCAWHEGAPRIDADQEAWGLARGAHYVQCADKTKMSVQIVPDHNWRPRRCFSVPTAGPSARTRLVFHKVQFARFVRMHDGLHAYEEDPQNAQANIKLSVSVRGLAEDGKMAELKLGENTHHNGEAWKAFDVDTSAVPTGEVGDLILDVESDAADHKFCLEGSTR